MGVIIFNNEYSDDYGIKVTKPPNYEIPERDYDVVHVPGKNGDVIIDNGSYKNVSRTYEISFGSNKEKYVEMANKLVQWLNSTSGYARLEDSYEPEYYRLASYKGGLSIENIFNKAGTATITFDCKPQRFLNSGDDRISLNKNDSAENLLKDSIYENINPNKEPNSNAPFDYENYDYTTEVISNMGCKLTGLIRLKNGYYRLTSDKKPSSTIIWMYNPYKGCYETLYGFPSSDWILSDNKYVYDFKVNTNYVHNYIRISSTSVNNFINVKVQDLSSLKIINPTVFKSSPIITVHGSGSGVIKIGEYTVNIKTINDGMIIDSEIQDVYYGTINKNSDVSFINGFPKLQSGINDISFSGGVTELEVKPKWWTL